MSHSKPCLAAARVAAVIVAGVLPLAAQAQEAWKWEGSINFWLPSIGGSTSIPPAAGGPSIDVNSDMIIDALKMAFLGSLEARKGQAGFYTDVVYVDLGGSKSGTRDFSLGHVGVPAGLDGNFKLDVKTLAWTVAGTYNVASTPGSSVDLLAGARLLDYKQTLDWQLNGTIAGGTPLPPRIGSNEISKNFWDAVVGVKGRANLGDDRRWFIPYYVDIGAGQSKSTWQANAGLGYQFQWGALSATWRYLDYKMKSGNTVESVNFSGPTIVAAFQW
jgi:hypothetical protein